MISVIIPTYKEPEYLDLCIESILSGQKYKNEIVVVVDGTKDINQSVLDKYKDKIKPIIFAGQLCVIFNKINQLIFNSSFCK